jgi:hypothetical protein
MVKCTIPDPRQPRIRLECDTRKGLPSRKEVKAECFDGRRNANGLKNVMVEVTSGKVSGTHGADRDKDAVNINNISRGNAVDPPGRDARRLLPVMIVGQTIEGNCIRVSLTRQRHGRRAGGRGIAMHLDGDRN